jgi:hypothetical protein
MTAERPGPGQSAVTGPHWEAAYPDPSVADDRDSSGCQVFGDLVQVGQDDG